METDSCRRPQATSLDGMELGNLPLLASIVWDRNSKHGHALPRVVCPQRCGNLLQTSSANMQAVPWHLHIS